MDISRKALAIARTNCPHNVSCICSDMLASLVPLPRFDFIVANPPYISHPELCALDRSVVEYEPRIALDGGSDGLNFYRILASEAHRYLKSGGRLYCEIGYLQGPDMRVLFSRSPWIVNEIHHDLAARPRLLVARISDSAI
jgi:release factor glutamine methyltransferase